MLDNIKLSFNFILKCLSSKFLDFKGRACRYEFFSYFFFYLFIVLVFRNIAINLQLSQALNYTLASVVLILSIALISALVRRLHDNNLSGLILLFMPILIALFILFTMNKTMFEANLYNIIYQAFSIASVVFYVILIAISAKKGTVGENKYGKDPIKNHIEYLKPL